MTRLEQLEHQGLAPQLPPPGPAAHLLAYLFEAGPVGYGAMGAVPLTHSEIQAWQTNTGIDLQSWEARSLRRLSVDYVSASAQAAAPDCPPFYLGHADQTDRRQLVAQKIKLALSALASKPQKVH